MRISSQSLVPTQVPEFVREDYPTFVAFIQAYYEYLDLNGVDLTSLRDLDSTLDEFIQHFKNELAANMPANLEIDDRFLLEHIKNHYLAKGSEQSFKFLFKLLYNKNVQVAYPGTQMLRCSDGRWQQDVSLFIKVTTGTPDLIEGKLVDVVKPNATFKVLVDRRQYVEIEVDRVVQLSDNTYEIFIDRRFFGNIEVGDVIRYSTIFAGTVVSTTSKLSIINVGTGFKAGQLFELKNGSGVRSIVKITRVSSTGQVLSCEFIKFGIGYATDFTISINSSQDYFSQPTQANALNSSVLVNGRNVIVTEATNGTAEQGYISKFDYAYTYGSGAAVGTVTVSGGGSVTAASVLRGGSNYAGSSNGANTVPVTFSSPVSGQTATGYAALTSGVVTSIVITSGGSGYTTGSPPTATIGQGDQQFYMDGTYVGNVIGTFTSQAISQVVSSVAKDSAILKVKLGSLANYPGYYTSNAGFLSDSVFIQDSRYYQAFSYVLKLDERLSSYKTAVRTMVHPAGTALFGEYQISNEFNISAALQSIVRILALSLKDSALMVDTGDTAGGLKFDVSKALTESVLISESQFFAISKTLTDSINTPTDAATNLVGKVVADSISTPTDSTTNLVGKALADSLSTPTETLAFTIGTGLADSLSTPTDSISAKDMTKYLTDATTSETDAGYVAKNPYSQGNYFAVTPIIYDNTIDSTF
jgi:hypothetical protein